MRLRVLASMAATVLVASGIDRRQVTFHRDVLPILRNRCQGCHRPGEIGPMSLLTYQDARPWAKAIREAVLLKKMPPWFADPRFGKFSNDRSLTSPEVETLVAWVDGGAVAGDPKPAPKPRAFAPGWNIGVPNAIFEMPDEFHVPASGVLEYQYFAVPTGFTEDRWVERAEVRPGNRAVVHHAIVFVRGPSQDRWPGFRQYLAGYAPGAVPQIWKPGQARLIPAGSTLVFQMHYTANGKPAADRTSIGLVLAKQPPEERIVAMTASNHWFSIPPGAADHRVDSSVVLDQPVSLVGMRAHMHLRGKSFEFRAVYPTGESEILLRIPRYSFNWQPYYYLEKPLPMPKGTRIECTAYYDNSPNNPRNPDPTAEVRWGEQSWEEMMIGWLDIGVRQH
jgi:hypothetical protein